MIESEEVKFIIQINGKKRSILNAIKDIDENDLLKLAKKNKIINKHLENKEIKKVIFVQNRLMNILTND